METGQYYIGKHSTTNINDGYLGSGLHLKRQIKKYGKDKFNKIILEYCNSIEQLNQREQSYVNADLLKDPLCLNIKLGGEGGFDYCQTKSPHNATKGKYWAHHKITHKNILINVDQPLPIDYIKGQYRNIDYTKNSEWKSSISISNKNNRATKNNNSHWCTKDHIWIFNPKTQERKLIKNNISIPDGWEKGFSCKHKGSPRKGSKWLVKNDVRKFVNPDQVQQYLNDGWTQSKRFPRKVSLQ